MPHGLEGGEEPGPQLPHVRGGVDQQNLLVGGGLRLDDVAGSDDPQLDELIFDATVFGRREDVISQLKKIAVRIDDSHRSCPGRWSAAVVIRAPREAERGFSSRAMVFQGDRR